MLEFVKLLWKPVERVLRLIGKIQSTILLSLFYFLVLAPVAILFQLARAVRPRPMSPTYWKKRDGSDETEITLLRQF